MLLRQGMHELELGGVGVLVFVHHHIAIAGATGLERLGMLGKEPQGEQDQIVEIHGVAGAQRGFVPGPDMLGHRADAFIGENGRTLAAILEPAQQAENGGGIRLFAPGGNPREDLSDRSDLLGFVVDDEVALVAELFDVLAQDADAERMEGAEGWPGRIRFAPARRGIRGRGLGVHAVASNTGFWTLDIPRDQFRDALLHFARGLVGEGHAQDVPRRNAGLDHVGDAKRDDAGLAGAGARKDQHRPLQRLDGKTLLRIERAEVRH